MLLPQVNSFHAVSFSPSAPHHTHTLKALRIYSTHPCELDKIMWFHKIDHKHKQWPGPSSGHEQSYSPFTFTFYIYYTKLSNMSIHMSCKISCPRGCKVTLIAFVWFFTTVCYQMSPQITCLRGCKVTLVAFV